MNPPIVRRFRQAPATAGTLDESPGASKQAFLQSAHVCYPFGSGSRHLKAPGNRSFLPDTSGSPGDRHLLDNGLLGRQRGDEGVLVRLDLMEQRHKAVLEVLAGHPVTQVALRYGVAARPRTSG